MAKILAKIARRNNSNDPPDRRELVEMDLFDTKRNPWPGDLGSGLWERHDFDPVVPFYPPVNASADGQQLVGPIDLVIERTSLVAAFVGAIYDVESGADPARSIALKLKADGDGGFVQAYTEQSPGTNEAGYRTSAYESYTIAVLSPATYSVSFFCWTTDEALVAHFIEVAATIAVLPAGLAQISGWGGTGG